MSYYGRSIDALTVVRNASPDAPSLRTTGFAWLLPSELEEILRSMRAELDLEVCMALCAGFEASLRTDYLGRVGAKKKEEATRVLRKLQKEQAERLALDDLIDAWSSISQKAALFGEFKQVMRYRDWLAHGRYWNQKSGLVLPTPDQIFERGQAVLEVLGQF